MKLTTADTPLKSSCLLDALVDKNVVAVGKDMIILNERLITLLNP